MSYHDHLAGVALDRLESLKRRGLLDEPSSAPYPGQQRSDYQEYSDPYSTGYGDRRSLLGRRPADDDYGQYPSSYGSHRQFGGYEPPVKRPLLEPSYSSYDSVPRRGDYGRGRGRGDFGRGRGEIGRGRGDFGQGRNEFGRGRGTGDSGRGRGDSYRGRGDGNRGRWDNSSGTSGIVRGRGGGVQGSGDANSRGRGGSRGSYSKSSTSLVKAEAKPENKDENEPVKSDIKSSDSKTPKEIKTDVKVPAAAEKEEKDSTPKTAAEPSAVKASEPKEMKKASKSESKPRVQASSSGLGRGLAACLMNMSDGGFETQGSSHQAEPSPKPESSPADLLKPITQGNRNNGRGKQQGGQNQDTPPTGKPNSVEMKSTGETVEKNQLPEYSSNGKDSISPSIKTTSSDTEGTFCQPCNSFFLNTAQYNAHVRGVIHEQNVKMSSNAMEKVKKSAKKVIAEGAASVAASTVAPTSTVATPPTVSKTTTLATPKPPMSTPPQPYKSPAPTPPTPTVIESSRSTAANDSNSDSDDDGTRCKVCKMSFDDRGKYIRHTKGLMHTQKKIEYEKSKGSTKYDDVPDTGTNQVFAFGNTSSAGRGRGSSAGRGRGSSAGRGRGSSASHGTGRGSSASYGTGRGSSSSHGTGRGSSASHGTGRGSSVGGMSALGDGNYDQSWSRPQKMGEYEAPPARSQQFAAYTEYDAEEEEYYDESYDNRKQHKTQESR